MTGKCFNNPIRLQLFIQVHFTVCTEFTYLFCIYPYYFHNYDLFPLFGGKIVECDWTIDSQTIYIGVF